MSGLRQVMTQMLVYLSTLSLGIIFYRTSDKKIEHFWGCFTWRACVLGALVFRFLPRFFPMEKLVISSSKLLYW